MTKNRWVMMVMLVLLFVVTAIYLDQRNDRQPEVVEEFSESFEETGEYLQNQGEEVEKRF